ncbi:MAG: type II toxin-antitoxin system RelB/DinJ family antitoxin [Oscillospiraceae bacterium]|nr:type II toxin-antitoxin system RelB/DinJ family antitoxin [Oscillospiraceae bacterium]
METLNYNIRLDPVLKTQAEETFESLGLGFNEAINYFLEASAMGYRIPLDLHERKPNASLLKAIEEAEQIIEEYKAGTRKPRFYANAREMFEAMDLEDETEDYDE